MSEAILPAQAIAQTSHQEKEWSLAKVVYTVLMALALLSHIWLMAIGAGIDNIPTYIWILRLIPVPFAICLSKLWKDRGFQILSLYLLLFFFRCFIPNPGSIFSVEMAESILSALWLFAACYGLGHILKRKQLSQFLLVIIFVWTLWITIISCIGVHAVWTDNPVVLPNKTRIGFYVYRYPRLNLIYIGTATGAVLSVSILMAAVAAICVRNKIVRSFFIIAITILLVAMALTDSRTAYISSSIGIGIIVSTCSIRILKKKKNISRKDTILYNIIGIIIFICVSIIAIIGIMKITPIFNQIKLKGIIPKAYADNAGTIEIIQRGFDGDRALTGRNEIWISIIKHIQNHPLKLLLGETKLGPLTNVDGEYGHSHCIVLQILLESGIPGLLLFISFIFQTGWKTIQVYTSDNQLLWIKLLPALLISLLIGDLAECYIWLRSSQCLMITVFFVSAGIITAQARESLANGLYANRR